VRWWIVHLSIHDASVTVARPAGMAPYLPGLPAALGPR
jgi:hypothetical protein